MISSILRAMPRDMRNDAMYIREGAVRAGGLYSLH